MADRPKAVRESEAERERRRESRRFAPATNRPVFAIPRRREAGPRTRFGLPGSGTRRHRRAHPSMRTAPSLDDPQIRRAAPRRLAFVLHAGGQMQRQPFSRPIEPLIEPRQRNIERFGGLAM